MLYSCESQFQWPKLHKQVIRKQIILLTLISSHLFCEPILSFTCKSLFWPPYLFWGHFTSTDSSFLRIYLFDNAKGLKPSPHGICSLWQQATVSAFLLIIPACQPVKAEQATGSYPPILLDAQLILIFICKFPAFSRLQQICIYTYI